MGIIDLWRMEGVSSYMENPEPNSKLYLRDIGKTRLIPIFEDENLTNTTPNPHVSDENGNFSPCFTFNGTYHLSIVNAGGQVVAEEASCLVRTTEIGVVSHAFDTIEALLDDDFYGYGHGASKRTVVPGDLVRVESDALVFRVSSEDATDHHLESAGGVKLYLQPDADGYYSVEGFGFIGDGTEEDRNRLQLACAFTPNLKFKSRIYYLGAYDPTPDGYGSHRFACIVAQNNIAWRTLGTTRLCLTDAVQTGANKDDISLLFMADQESFSAPGFTFDENASGQGFGAPLAFYGVESVDLCNVTICNSNPVRLGASELRRCGEIKGNLTLKNCFGTFAVGGKPGGVNHWRNFSATIATGRGGVNLESEDVDNRGLPYVAMDARISSVIGDNLHGGNSPVEMVKIEDGCEDAVVGSIVLRNASSTGTGRATALSIKKGQIGPGPKTVDVETISAHEAEQAIYIENGQGGIGAVKIGSVQVNNVGNVLTCIRGGADKVTSVLLGSIQGTVQSPSGPNLGTVISVENGANGPERNDFPPHLTHLAIKGGHLSSVRERSFSIRGASVVSCEGLTVDAHTSASPSGGYAGSVYNVIEADDIVLTNTTLKGFAGSAVPLELRPKRSCRLVGLDIEANSSGTALFLNGSGHLILDNCRFSNATNAINFRSIDTTFDAAALDLGNNQLIMPGHVFRHGEKVRYAEGSSPIGGLSNNTDYFVLYVDDNTVSLSSSLRGDPIDLTSLGAGSANLRKALEVKVNNTRNECTSLAANSYRPLSFVASGTW